MFTRLSLALGCLFTTLGNAQEPSKSEVLAQFGKGGAGSGIFVYSKDKLSQVSFWNGQSWLPLTTLPDQGEYKVFKTPAPVKPIEEGNVFRITARFEDSSRFTDALKAAKPAEDGTVAFEVTRERLEDAETVLALDKKAEEERLAAIKKAQEAFNASPEGQFMLYLNAERARNGAGPLSYCYAAAASGHSNNNYGLGHAVTYNPTGTSAQNSAPTTDPYGAFQMWMGSSGHRTNMLNGTYTRAGIGFSNGHATLNLYR